MTQKELIKLSKLEQAQALRHEEYTRRFTKLEDADIENQKILAGIQRSITDLNLGLNETLNKTIARVEKAEEKLVEVEEIAKNNKEKIESIDRQLLKYSAYITAGVALANFLMPIVIDWIKG